METETPVSEPEKMEEDFTVRIGATYSCKREDGTYHDAEVVKSRMNKRAGREEFFVHYNGLPCRQNEWVDKTRLVLVGPEEEEIDEAAEDGTSEEKTGNGNESEKQKSDEEEPQPKKIKVDVHEPPANSSLLASGDFAEELTCPLCIELFKDPVVIQCGHNFCRSCLDEAWEGQDSFTCPECKEVTTEQKYTNNRALANLVKKTATPAKSVVKEKPRLPENCLVHDERLKLFCKDDGDLGCVICRESLKHTNHNFLPILDAVGVYRGDLTSIVSPLEDALKVAEKMAEQQNEKIENHKTTMAEYEDHIKSEFKKLHQLLNEREEKFLEKLQAESSSLLMEMEANIAKMEENITSLKESISLASEKLDNTDAVSFLTDIKSFINKCDEQKKEALSSKNTLVNKELSSETYKAPITFSTFVEEMTKLASCTDEEFGKKLAEKKAAGCFDIPNPKPFSTQNYRELTSCTDEEFGKMSTEKKAAGCYDILNPKPFSTQNYRGRSNRGRGKFRGSAWGDYNKKNRCFNCGVEGHWGRDCPMPHRKEYSQY